MAAHSTTAPPPPVRTVAPRDALPPRRNPLERRDGLSKTQLRAVIATIAVLHVAGGWGVLQIPAVREAVTDAAPLFVDFITPPAPPTPEPPKPPPPPPPRQIPKVQPPPAVMAAAPSPAPAPFVVPPPPPAPVPAPEPPPPIEPPPAPPAPAAPAKTLPSEAVKYLVEPQLVYPTASQRLREHGTVLVRVFIDEGGMPREVQVSRSSGFPRLNDAAVTAVRKARFKPYVENGRPTAGWAFIPLVFDPEN